MEPTRRGLITGLISFVAAPAIVRATSIMPVKAMTDVLPLGLPCTPWQDLYIIYEWQKGDDDFTNSHWTMGPFKQRDGWEREFFPLPKPAP